jgi:hypothetical protein
MTTRITLIGIATFDDERSIRFDRVLQRRLDPLPQAGGSPRCRGDPDLATQAFS